MQSKQCSKSDFYAFLKKEVIAVINKPEVTKEIEGEIDCERFLPKQTDKRNSVIPYQLYEYELKQIIKNLKDRVPFINDNSEKILQLFKFKVPYYVGPCNKVNDGGQEKFSWAVRNSDEKIYPWNFEKVIDVESSAEKFIRRMTNKCTYLRGEDVLPKDSLLYSKYMVLNELNNLKINNEKIPVNLKQKIYTDLFCKHRKVTFKKLQTYLKQEGIISDNDVISGIDGDFKSSLKAYHDFKEKFTGIDLKTEDKERIVLDVMLFGADKKLLKQRIKRMYPNFTEKQINTVASLSYSGWGRFSKAFLEDIVVNETDHEQNIITALWETEDNLMQLLSQSHGFSEQIEKRNVIDHDTKITYKTVNDLYASPAVKRQLWHILKVTNEVVSIMGFAPKRIFLEMAREKQESKRTDSRKKQLEDLYKALNKECSKDPQIIQTIKELSASLETKDDYILRKDRVFLYYMQLGRDIYTGLPLYLKYAAENDENVLLEYFVKNKELVAPHIIIPKIKLGVLCKVNGVMMRLSGSGGENRLNMNNAFQLVLSPESTKTLNYLTQYINVKIANKKTEVQILRRDKLNQDSLTKLYDEFIFKAQSTVYSRAKSTMEVGNLLKNKRSTFDLLTDEDKCYVLYQILHIFQCNPALADLKLINGASTAGRIRISADLKKYTEFKIIHKSITGFYEEEIDLLTYELENYSRKQKS